MCELRIIVYVRQTYLQWCITQNWLSTVMLHVSPLCHKAGGASGKVEGQGKNSSGGCEERTDIGIGSDLAQASEKMQKDWLW